MPQFVSPANRAENGRCPNGDLGGLGPEDVKPDRDGDLGPRRDDPVARRLSQVDGQRIPGKALDADHQRRLRRRMLGFFQDRQQRERDLGLIAASNDDAGVERRFDPNTHAPLGLLPKPPSPVRTRAHPTLGSRDAGPSDRDSTRRPRHRVDHSPFGQLPERSPDSASSHSPRFRRLRDLPCSAVFPNLPQVSSGQTRRLDQERLSPVLAAQRQSPFPEGTT